MPVASVYGPTALLVALATAVTELRIASCARGQRPSLVILPVPVGVAFGYARFQAPINGPMAAVWAAIVGMLCWLILESFAAWRARSRPFTA